MAQTAKTLQVTVPESHVFDLKLLHMYSICFQCVNGTLSNPHLTTSVDVKK